MPKRHRALYSAVIGDADQVIKPVRSYTLVENWATPLCSVVPEVLITAFMKMMRLGRLSATPVETSHYHYQLREDKLCADVSLSERP